MGETQPENGFFKGSSIYQSLLAKSRQFNPICDQNLILQHSITGFCMQLKIFHKAPALVLLFPGAVLA